MNVFLKNSYEDRIIGTILALQAKKVRLGV